MARQLRFKKSTVRPVPPKQAWRQILCLIQGAFRYKRCEIERRGGMERRLCRHLLRHERRGDHVIFCVILILIFLAVDTYMAAHWVKMPLDATFAALSERLLFGGRG